MKFIIYIPFFTPVCGGVVVLAKLCDLMNRLGYETYSTIPIDYNNFVIPVLTQEKLNTLNRNPNDYAVIYPEQVEGNPFFAKNVIRWILYTPDVNKGHGTSYDLTDYIFKFSSNYSILPRYKTDGILHVNYVNHDIFHDYLLSPRNGSCYIIKKDIYKKTRKPMVHDLNQSTCIDGLSIEQVASEFNKREFFYSYDSYCFYSVLAALCGCVSVVIPDDGLSKADWINSLPYTRFGIAYGLDDIPWAKETKHLVSANLKDIENETTEQIHQMVRIIQRPKS